MKYFVKMAKEVADQFIPAPGEEEAGDAPSEGRFDEGDDRNLALLEDEEDEWPGKEGEADVDPDDPIGEISTGDKANNEESLTSARIGTGLSF